MKKVFRLENLDCANCAAKMERSIAKIKGVEKVNVNFMAQKMTIEASEEAFAEITAEIRSVCRKVEPDCIIRG